MMLKSLVCGIVSCGMASMVWAREAESRLRATILCDRHAALNSGDLTESPRDGNSWTGGIQALLYPTWES